MGILYNVLYNNIYYWILSGRSTFARYRIYILGAMMTYAIFIPGVHVISLFVKSLEIGCTLTILHNFLE